MIYGQFMTIRVCWNIRSIRVRESRAIRVHKRITGRLSLRRRFLEGRALRFYPQSIVFEANTE